MVEQDNRMSARLSIILSIDYIFKQAKENRKKTAKKETRDLREEQQRKKEAISKNNRGARTEKQREQTNIETTRTTRQENNGKRNEKNAT